MKLKYVTFTGVDTQTDLQQLKYLSADYSFIEWGVLVSSKPKIKTNSIVDATAIINDMKVNASLSLHICGNLVPLAINFHPIIYELLSTINAHSASCRVQLNFSHADHLVSIPQLQWFIKEMKCPVIIQINKNNIAIPELISNLSNLQYLFDSSGGRGKEIDAIPLPICDPKYPLHNNPLLNGYAGGISSDNLFSILGKIGGIVHPNNQIWIDMETSLRSMEYFDVSKCLNIINKLKDTTYVE